MIRILLVAILSLFALTGAGAVTVDAGPAAVAASAGTAEPTEGATDEDARESAAAVTAGVHEDGLPTPPLSLVLAAAALGGILLLNRSDGRARF